MHRSSPVRFPNLKVIMPLLLALAASLYAQATPPAAAVPGTAPAAATDSGEAALVSAYAQWNAGLSPSQRSGSLSFLIQHDTNSDRLANFLSGLLKAPQDDAERATVASELGSLETLRGDFSAALDAYSAGGDKPELMLSAARMLLLLGRKDEAETRLTQILAAGPGTQTALDAGLILSWKKWADGDGQSALKLIAGRNDAAALYLSTIVSRSLGLKKDSADYFAKLSKLFPSSVYYDLANDDSDSSVILDTEMTILSGIGTGTIGVSAAKSSDDGSVARGIQVGYFKDTANAKAFAATLVKKGFSAQVEEELGSSSRYKVIVTVKKGQDPQTLILKLKDIGIEGFLVF